MLETCVLAGIFPCGAPAVAVYEMGCEHEHLDPHIPICADHIRHIETTNWFCIPCGDAGEHSHSCPTKPHLLESELVD